MLSTIYHLLYALYFNLEVVAFHLFVTLLSSSIGSQVCVKYCAIATFIVIDDLWLNSPLVDQSTLLFGTIFWGTLYTAILVGFSAMIFLGICLWPDFAGTVVSVDRNRFCCLLQQTITNSQFLPSLSNRLQYGRPS